MNRAASGEVYEVIVSDSDRDKSLVPSLLFPPGTKLVNNGNQPSSCICKTILNLVISAFRFFEDTLDDAVLFELAKDLDEHELIDSVETAQDLGEFSTHRIVEEQNDGCLPVITDKVKSIEDRERSGNRFVSVRGN